MDLHCPICGETCQTDFEPEIGQHIICPYCNTKFSYAVKSDSIPKTSPRKSVSFDFDRCERELSEKWNNRGKRRKTKKNKWWIFIIVVGLLANLVFFVFGLPVCLEKWRADDAAEAAAQQIQDEKRLAADEYAQTRKWYYQTLRYNGLSELTRASGWTKAGGFILTLTNDNGPGTYTLDYSPRMGQVVFPQGLMSPGLAMELVQARIKIAKYETEANSKSKSSRH